MKRILGILFLLTLMFGASMSAVESKVKLTNKQVKAMIATAKTPADHLKLARYYDQKADRMLAESKDHEEMAEAYRKNPMNRGTKFFPTTLGHCEYFAKTYRENAAKMREMAAEHRAMAESAGK